MNCPDNYPYLTLPRPTTKAQLAVFACMWESAPELAKQLPDAERKRFYEETLQWMDTGNDCWVSLSNRVLVGMAWLHVAQGWPLALPTPEQSAAIEAIVVTRV